MQSVGPFVIRDGDWKLCLCPGSGSTGRFGNEPTPDEAWKKALEEFGNSPTWKDLTRTPFVQLFNLADDPHEDNNLAAKHPDRVDIMIALLRQDIRDGRSTLGPKPNYVVKQVNITPRVPNSVRKLLNRGKSR